MKFFNKLQEYDPEYHQIHIEEINYIKEGMNYFINGTNKLEELKNKKQKYYSIWN